MRQSDIQTKIDTVTDNLGKLEILRAKTLDEFSDDFRNIDSAEHRLQTTIQALLDMGSYIIASLGLRTPETNAEVITVLLNAGYIEHGKEKKFIAMAQFRNRIVHLYNHIDLEILYEILQNDLNDMKELYTILLNIIEKHER